MQLHVSRILILFITFVTVIFVIASLRLQETVLSSVNRGWRNNFDLSELPHRVLYRSWKRCIVEKTASFRNNYKETWTKIAAVMQECEQPIVRKLNIKVFSNSDEDKRHIIPLNKEEYQTVITIGVGHDTRAEEQLLQTVGNKSVEFFGADPMIEINRALYSKFGAFFPFAVSSKPGILVANVLEQGTYKDKLVINVDAVYFFTKLIGKTFFDNVWMDAEGAEYELFDFINAGGAFDQNNITICQMNMEIHNPDDKKMRLASDFIYRTLEDERYGMFYALTAVHMRLFFVNFSDKACVDKYIPKK